MSRKRNTESNLVELTISTKKDVEIAIKYLLRKQQNSVSQAIEAFLYNDKQQMDKHFADTVEVFEVIKWFYQILVPLMNQHKMLVVIDEQGKLLKFETKKTNTNERPTGRGDQQNHQQD